MLATCPNCKRKLRIPDGITEQFGRCNQCGQVFPLSGQAGPVLGDPPLVGDSASKPTEGLRATSAGQQDPIAVWLAANPPPRPALAGAPAQPPVSPASGQPAAAVATPGTGRAAAVPAAPPPRPSYDALMSRVATSVTSGLNSMLGSAADVLHPPGPQLTSRTSAAAEMSPRASAGGVISIWHHRHEKEKVRFLLAAAFSTFVWLIVGIVSWPFLLAAGIIWLPALPGFLLVHWAFMQMQKAKITGSSLRVTEEQCPEIHQAATRIAARLGLGRLPDIYVVNSEGAVNAFALWTMGDRYVFLNSALVDLMLSHGRWDELNVILAHELAHHAAGHTTPWRRWLLKPAMLLPFFGAAYSRACELTADRLALALTANVDAAAHALTALAHGSVALSKRVSTTALIRQEDQISPLIGLLAQIYSSHPRLTQRLAEVQRYAIRQAA